MSSYKLSKTYSIGDIHSYLDMEEVEISITTHNRELLLRLDDEISEIIEVLKEEKKNDS